MSKKTLRILTLVTGILGIIALLWLLYDYVMYNRLRPLLEEVKDLGRLEKLAEGVWLSYLFLLVYHVLAAGTLVLQAQYTLRIQLVSIMAIVIGIFSFFGVFSEWAVFGDIGKEYKMGWDTSGEWSILYIILGIHAVFLLMVTGICAVEIFHSKLLEQEKMPDDKEETVFIIAQYVGIICGASGLGILVLGLFIGRTLPVSIYHTLSTTILILIPYGLIAGYWIILKLKENFRNWYDEKQWRDVSRAGFTTLLLLVPILLVYYIVFSIREKHFDDQVTWYPVLLFTMLFLFSLLTLINYRKS
jgi:hypothetical protein